MTTSFSFTLNRTTDLFFKNSDIFALLFYFFKILLFQVIFLSRKVLDQILNFFLMLMTKIIQLLLILFSHFNQLYLLRFLYRIRILGLRKIRMRCAVSERLLENGLDGRRSLFFWEVREVMLNIVEHLFIRTKTIAHKLNGRKKRVWWLYIHLNGYN